MRSTQPIRFPEPGTKEALAAIAAMDARPRLRGVSHQLAAFLVPPIVSLLVRAAPSPRAALLAALYGGSLTLLFGLSALYHRRRWSPTGFYRMQRIDHANIFLFVTGSYAPICLLGIGGSQGALLFGAIALGSTFGVAQTLFWPKAPRALHVALYVVVGWAGAAGIGAEGRNLGWDTVALHVLGGVLYTVGAMVYARKRPNPVPGVFGFHEIFHLFVIAACGCLFEVIRRSVLRG